MADNFSTSTQLIGKSTNAELRNRFPQRLEEVSHRQRMDGFALGSRRGDKECELNGWGHSISQPHARTA